MSGHAKNSISICGERLKSVMEQELSILGPTGLEVLFEEMQACGFRFQQNSVYTMEQLHSFLLKILGKDGAGLITQRITDAIGRS